MITFRGACRENTGAHFLDSGGAYGRHYEAPPIPEKSPLYTWTAYDIENQCGPTIETGAFLEEWSGGVDDELQTRFEEWESENGSDLNWFESGKKFCRDVLGLQCAGRDNVYNGENDLSQVYVWEVWKADSDGDWIYPDDSTVAVFYIHTGCDVRGGYGRPLFVRPAGQDDYSVPVDLCAGFYPAAAWDPAGTPMDGRSQPRLDGESPLDVWDVPEIDELSPGYSSNPSYHLFDKWADKIEPGEDEGTAVAWHKGYKVVLAPDVRTGA